MVEVEGGRFILEDLAHDLVYISASPLTEKILFSYWFEELGVREIADMLGVRKQFVRTVLSKYRSKYSAGYVPLFLKIYRLVRDDIRGLYRIHPNGNLSCNLCEYSTPENLALANHFSLKHYDVVYDIIARRMKVRVVAGKRGAYENTAIVFP